MSLVLVEIDGSIGTLTLNNPAKRNSLSAALIDELIAGFDSLAEAGVRVAVLRAPAGSKVWSAGHNVHELPRQGRDPLGYDDPLRKAVRAIATFRGPVIAMIEGTVWGGACEVAMSCDLLLITPEVTFCLTPARLGVPYNISGVLNFTKSMPLPIIKELFFTAAPISAQRALELGMVNYVKRAAQLESFTRALALQICENSPLCVSVIKEQLRILSEASPLSPDTFERLQSLRREVYDSHDYDEGIQAFLEKRKAVFSGA